MKRIAILTIVLVMLAAGAYISRASNLNAAQKAALQAQQQELMSLIMPPPPPTPSPAMLEKIQGRQAMMATMTRMSPMGGGSPMDNIQPALPSFYQVIDLGTLGGSQSYAYGINAAGTVVGASLIDSSYTSHAFEYDSQIHDIATGTSGIVFSQANGINNKGDVVGWGIVSANSSVSSALEYSGGVVQNLIPSVAYNCTATGINNSGQVVGYSSPRIFIEARPHPDITYNQNEDAFMITGGNVTDLGDLDGFSFSQGWGINDSGMAVGYAQENSPFAQHAFSYSGNGPMVDLDSALGGTGYSAAYGVNNSGQIVGGGNTAFIYNSGTGVETDLGALGDLANYSTAYGINNNGVAVGTVYINSIGDNHAFVSSGESMQDLNTLIDPASGWDLQYATAINDAGQIVGYGTDPSGDTHAFLLYPYYTWNVTGYHQFDSVASGVPADFGKPDKADFDADGTLYGSDDCALTKDYGCALCSLSSMLTSIPGQSMVPAQLNADLIANNGYENGCEMNWPAINTITGAALLWADSGTVVKGSLSDHSALDQYLNEHCWGNRYRVILQLEQNGDPSETHYILVTGKTANDWTVFDPGWSNAFIKNTDSPSHPELLTTLYAGHLTGFRSNHADRTFTVTGAEAYEIDSSIPSGSFCQVVHSPVELLVTDPNGNKVGYDPVAGADVFGIPHASYTRDYPILDANADTDGGGSAGDVNGIKIVDVPGPVGGYYSTALIGTGPGSYTFDTSIVWPGNSETNETVTGMTDVGIVTTNLAFVITPPVITSSSASGGTFSLSFAAQTNITYAIQGVNSLLNTNWTSLTTVTATSTNQSASVPMSDPDMMFYRVVSQ